MKRSIIILSLFALSVISLSSCSSVSVDGGQEAVLIEKPMFFGHGGVDETPITSGREFVALTTDNVKFSIIPQTKEEDFDKLMTKDNTPVTLTTFIKYQIRKGQTPTLYKNFGVDWYAHSIGPTFWALVRDKASQYRMFELTSDREILAGLEKTLFETIAQYTVKQGLPVDILQVTIGKVTPPDEVLEETRRTAAQNQSILTQQARSNAELSRKQAEINKAIADNAYKQQMNMSTAEYLALRQLEIEKEKIEIVRDKQNVSIIMGQGLQPTIPIKQ